MIGYRDMTFCDGAEGKCIHFGNGCPRSLTKEVQEAAESWWNPKGEKEAGEAPIALFMEPKELECYKEEV